MSKSIIIIGAGVAGLSAGCYGQMNGYQTRIFELHNLPGGLCTSWNRKGYTIDGCIHWLVGSSPANSFHQVWEELGAIQGRTFINHEEFVRIEGENGKTLIIYTNSDRLEEHLKELAPADSKLIEEFTGAIRAFSKMNMQIGKAEDLYNFFDKAKAFMNILPLIPLFGRYQKVTLEEFANRFTDPFVKNALKRAFGLPGFPVIGMMMTLGWMHAQSAGYPIGGSLEFARAIEQRYLSLGGKIHYQSRVEQIIVEDDRAVGVRLTDGSEHRAEYVISAADGHATIFDMLGGRYINDEIRGYYENLPIFEPLIQVTLGVERDLQAEPPMIHRKLKNPMTICGKPESEIGIKCYNYDPTLAPAGKSILMVSFLSKYDYWQKLSQAEYKAEKQKITDEVISALEQIYPGISGQIEVVDVATPLTFKRYTNNWQGSFEGWMITPETMMLKMKKTLPGLNNFYMIGQWVQPGGGLPPAGQHGRDVIQLLCKQDKKSFTTSKPAASGSKQSVTATRAV